MDGNDALVIMPTGWGKSLCFQLPALLLDGLTIVISPLIALMKDQVDSLRANGVPAAFLNSSLDEFQRQEILQKVKSKELKLLYLSPESTSTFELVKELTTISLIAIDEAHCISSWGHDFRPAYKQLTQLKIICPQVPIVALTATADKTTRKDILEQLSIPDATLFLSSFDRPNISLTVRPGQKRIEQIRSILSTKPWESWIIYCLSRGSTEKIAQKLSALWFTAEAYHAWLDHATRQKVQDNFLMDRSQVICATIAFGMWIDKSNVRWIIHYNLPKNIEWYYQEIGRAWRDWVSANTFLFYSYADVIQLTKFAEDSGNSKVQLAKLERMKQYAESLTCRRKILLHYFWESKQVDCWNCDVCLHPPQLIDGSIIAQKVLSTVYKLWQSEPMSTVIDVLRGSKNAYILGKKYNALSTHGLGSKKSYQDWQWYIIQLLNLWYLELAFHARDSLILTDTAKKVLFEWENVQLAKPHQEHISIAPPKWTIADKKKWYSLFEQLKSLRLTLSTQEWIPWHSLFSDATLQHIQASKPNNLSQLYAIQWLWDAKIEKYGKQILEVVNAFQVLSWNRTPKPTWVQSWSTFMKTYDLLSQGKSPQEISKERDLWISTIYTHIARLYSSWKIQDVSAYISQHKVDLVAQAMTLVTYKWKLKPIYDHIGWKVSYDEIRIGISVVQKFEKEE